MPVAWFPARRGQKPTHTDKTQESVGVCVCVCRHDGWDGGCVYYHHVPTVSQKLQQRQVNGPFPAGVLLQSDAVSRGGEHFPAADGHQLAAFVLPGHVVQNGGVVDESVQLPARKYIIFIPENV